MSKRKLTYINFKQYFSNNLPTEDKHAFEKQMMQDAFEEEAFDGLSKLSKYELEHDITELKSGINKKSKNTRRLIPLWFRYAASVIILIGIGVSIFLFNNLFLQDSILKEQISKEMEIADSIILKAEKEIQQFVEKNEKDTSREIAQELIADNRKSEVKKTAKNDQKISDAYVTEADETIEANVILEMVKFEEEKETTAENVVKNEQVVQSLSGAVAGVTVKKNTSPLMKETDKKSSLNSEEYISSQEKKVPKLLIKGKVVSTEDYLSIPGVSIVLEDNPGVGTTTNINGEFALVIPDDDEELKTLIAAFVGMGTKEISILGDTNLLVYMEPDVLEMDEIVVTAYGVSSKNEDDSEIESTEAKPSNLSGKAKYKKELINKLDYSKFKDFPGKHKIQFTFTVESNGKLSNFNFTKSPDTVFNNEIIRVIIENGNWIPASEKNQNINSIVNFNVKIEVQ